MYIKHLIKPEYYQIWDTTREFVDKEIIPNKQKMQTDRDLVDKTLQKLVDLGFQRAGYPKEYGGGGLGSFVLMGIIQEELARGDPGISIQWGLNAGQVLLAAVLANNKTVMEKFIPVYTGDKLKYACLAMTDAEGGCDTENPLFEGNRIHTIVRYEGNEIVINGSKNWPTNAGFSEVYLVYAREDPPKGPDGVAMVYVPAGTPGLSFGKPERKCAFKSSVNASVFFDDVRVPKEYQLVGRGKDYDWYYGVTAGITWAYAHIQIGIARRALELILDYTGTRMGGGKPVRQHSIVAGVIADMSIGIKMMQASAYNMAYMLEHPEEYGPPWSKEMLANGAATKIFAGDTSLDVVVKGMELMAANGISEDYEYEQLYRDVITSKLTIAGHQVGRFRVIEPLYELQPD